MVSDPALKTQVQILAPVYTAQLTPQTTVGHIPTVISQGAQLRLAIRPRNEPVYVGTGRIDIWRRKMRSGSSPEVP